MAERSWDTWTMVRLLPAQVEIAAAAGEVATARRAAESLAALGESFDSPTLRASTHEGWGRVALAEGNAEEAVRELRAAISSWRDVPAPYEGARCRVVLASALRRLDLDDDAKLELETALAEFLKLGAVRDAAETDRALRPGSDGTRRRKTFMFTDIVNSTSLAEAMGDEAWEHLLVWHDETLRSAVDGHGGEVVKSTGDGYFVAFDAAPDAVECAVAIQRALIEHRRSHGFAPGVRIGLHTAEATHRGDDYRGTGVHAAARIAALAGGGEILASVATAAEAGGAYPLGEPATVSLKGFAEPVDVVSISWTA